MPGVRASLHHRLKEQMPATKRTTAGSTYQFLWTDKAPIHTFALKSALCVSTVHQNACAVAQDAFTFSEHNRFFCYAILCAKARQPGAFYCIHGAPSTHYFHVEVNCSGFQGDSISFKMPAWAPGYYWIMNYSKNVINFKAADESGKQLACDKTGKNEWRVIKRRM